MSFVVVIKGPVARAGSILYLCKTNGMIVPKIPAKKITEIKAILTVMEILQLIVSPCGKKILYMKIKLEQTNPLVSPVNISLTTLFQLPFNPSDLFARPLTTKAED